MEQVATKTFTLSPQQVAILDWVANGEGSLNVIARAGCGKTSTLVEIVRAIPSSQSVFLGAFNKKIADELTERIGYLPNVKASTMHSAGFRVWRSVASRAVVNEKKMMNILRESLTPGDMEAFGNAVRKTVSIAKQSLFDKDTEDDRWADLIEHHDLLDISEGVTPNQLIDVSRSTLAKSIARDHAEIDFDDMIYAPIIHECNFTKYKYDWVLIDEAQDTNAARRELAFLLLKNGGNGRMIAVGDDRQAIYGFTGADSDAMDLIREFNNAITLPLTITYRCPRKVVAEANAYVPDIVADASAPEGVVSRVGSLKAKSLKPSDAILCRLTAPLVSIAYRLIRERVACHVEGRDIGMGLKKMAQRFRVTYLNDLESALTLYFETEGRKLLAKDEEEKAAALEDRVNTLLELIAAVKDEGKDKLADLLMLIDEMFADTEAGARPRVTLSTIHKAKGREWDRVFLVNFDTTIPSKFAKKEWQLAQEFNIAYVGITRSKRELVYLKMPKNAADGVV